MLNGNKLILWLWGICTWFLFILIVWLIRLSMVERGGWLIRLIEMLNWCLITNILGNCSCMRTGMLIWLESRLNKTVYRMERLLWILRSKIMSRLSWNRLRVNCLLDRSWLLIRSLISFIRYWHRLESSRGIAMLLGMLMEKWMMSMIREDLLFPLIDDSFNFIPSNIHLFYISYYLFIYLFICLCLCLWSVYAYIIH